MGAQGQSQSVAPQVPQAQGKGGASAKPFQQMQNMNQMGNAPQIGAQMGVSLPGSQGWDNKAWGAASPEEQQKYMQGAEKQIADRSKMMQSNLMQGQQGMQQGMQQRQQMAGQMGQMGQPQQAQAGKGGGIKQPQQQMPGGMAGGMRIGLK
jgi:hypothetical protein